MSTETENKDLTSNDAKPVLDEVIKDLENRLTNVIKNYCNAIGCRDCPLKWDEGCSATELQDKIYELEFGK